MISFVWSSDYPVLAGTGGSETYTIGHIRELRARGITAQLVTVGFGDKDGRENFPDVPFVSMSPKQIAELDGQVIFVSEPMDITTKHPAYVILHCPPRREKNRSFYLRRLQDKRIITNSQFGARLWTDYLGLDENDVDVVYPFAAREFGEAPMARRNDKKIRILFAGRLTAEKGIYTFLSALHLGVVPEITAPHNVIVNEFDLDFTVATPGANMPEGKIIEKLLRAHPYVHLTPARTTPVNMAALLAEHDIVIMPSSSLFWHETFGILSLEAQHTGCRVVASDDGGLPETDCGGLSLVEPDNPLALAQGILKAAQLGRMTNIERRRAAKKFTLSQSVDSLLRAINYTYLSKNIETKYQDRTAANGSLQISLLQQDSNVLEEM